MEKTVNVRNCCIALILVFLVCTLRTWVRPGSESAGLSIGYQLEYVIIPMLVAFIGVWNDRMKRGLRIALIVAGYAFLYLSVYLLIKNSGLMMNIGKIDMSETTTWLTTWFYVAMGVSVVSLLADLMLVIGKK